jgi:hypothetical protein
MRMIETVLISICEEEWKEERKNHEKTAKEERDMRIRVKWDETLKLYV